MSPRAGSRTFETWVRRHHAAVYRSAHRILRSEADAMDVTQQVFLAALEREERIAGAEEPERVLRAMAVRAALMHLRSDTQRRRREDRYAMDARERDERKNAGNEPPAAVAKGEQRRALWRFVQGLSEELRIPLLLRYQEGMTYARIAESVGCGEATAHERVRRGLDRLRVRLGRAGLGALAVGVERELGVEPPAAVPGGLEQTLLALHPARAGFVASGVVSVSYTHLTLPTIYSV